MFKNNDPKKHHYVPQFYLRQFSCPENKKKVQTISLHPPFLIKKESSIARIGYEDNLYKIEDKNIKICIEENLNKNIETPVSQSETWKKIKEGRADLLNETDKIIIYILMRHLETRNIEMLEFIKLEASRAKNPKYSNEYTHEEKEMHRSISDMPLGYEQHYLDLSNNIEQFLSDYKKASISIYESNIPIRTSTLPVINVPIHILQKREFDPKTIMKWFPLSPKFGAMLNLNKNYCNFGEVTTVDDSVIKFLNKQFLVQLLKSRTTRHLIASDNDILADFKWAGVERLSSNPRKFRV